MITLQLPPTIRIPRMDEVPSQSISIINIIEQASESNNVVEGYKLVKNEDKEYPYDFYSAINIDNDRLWNLFISLLAAMPNSLSLITAQKDDETKHSDYQDRDGILKKLIPFEKELAQDGFINFGVTHHTDKYLEQIFVQSAKYIQYWGKDMHQFLHLMEKYSLNEIDEIEFIDQYPTITTALHTLDSNTLPTVELLQKLRNN